MMDLEQSLSEDSKNDSTKQKKKKKNVSLPGPPDVKFFFGRSAVQNSDSEVD